MFHPLIQNLIYYGCVVSGIIFSFMATLTAVGVVLILANGGVV